MGYTIQEKLIGDMRKDQYIPNDEDDAVFFNFIGFRLDLASVGKKKEVPLWGVEYQS